MSGRAGHRGKDERCICIIMIDEQSHGELSFGLEIVCWKNANGSRTIEMIGDIEKVAFMKLPGDYCLEIHTRDGFRHRFGGFEHKNQKWLESYFKRHRISFTLPKIYVGGQNKGSLDMTDHQLSLVHGQMATSLDNVS